MPIRIRLLGRYANGVVAVFFVLLSGLAFSKDELGIALFCGAIAALCAFNVYLAEKAAAVCSEEERLAAEIRKAELRRKLMGLTEDTPETVARNYGL